MIIVMYVANIKTRPLNSWYCLDGTDSYVPRCLITPYTDDYTFSKLVKKNLHFLRSLSLSIRCRPLFRSYYDHACLDSGGMRIDNESAHLIDLGLIVDLPSCKCRLSRNASDKLFVTLSAR
jgi:hypothetical protein